MITTSAGVVFLRDDIVSVDTCALSDRLRRSRDSTDVTGIGVVVDDDDDVDNDNDDVNGFVERLLLSVVCRIVVTLSMTDFPSDDVLAPDVRDASVAAALTLIASFATCPNGKCCAAFGT